MEFCAPAVSDVNRGVLTRLCDVPRNGGKDAIYENIRRANDRIPTLHSLYQDLKYLETVANPIKLLAGPTKLTVQQSLEHIFVEDQHAFEESYWKLWLFSMKNFHKLFTAIMVRKNANRPKLICEQNLHILAEFAQIADELGFSSSQIDKYIESTPVIIVAREFFSKFRPRDVYVYDNGVFEEEIRNLSAGLCRFQKCAKSTRKSALTGENPVKVTRRTGHPFENHHERDADNFILENMLGLLPLERDNDITTFLCRRSWFIAFFVELALYSNKEYLTCPSVLKQLPKIQTYPLPSEAESPLSVEGQPLRAPEGHLPPTHEFTPPPPPPEAQSPPSLSPGPGMSRRRPRYSSNGANKKKAGWVGAP
ncbi:uncharacterized protein H6S33_004123 [Morchella sextelata]|uniref:uncharacterized protein n=1 Tax=Morchella sextelata TaxID=1174677 RepID=UPI001D046CEB|nr:uncharacterized protein H6S33_004123 [Morchella sextelata]KAH0606462.1 hypothetical protein H6S33_004123 [Morchella sextelata]